MHWRHAATAARPALPEKGLWLCLLFVLAGCASSNRLSFSELSCREAPLDLAVPVSGDILHGFDPFDRDPSWYLGDRVLYAVRLESGEETKDWIVLASVARLPGIEAEDAGGERFKTVSFQAPGIEPVELVSRYMDVRVEVYDKTGRVLGDTVTAVPEGFLRTGFYRHCAWGSENRLWLRTSDDTLPVAATAQEVRYLVEPIITLTALFEVVMTSEVLSPILWEVVRKPSFLSLLFEKLRISINVELAEAEVQRSHLADALGTQAYCLPVEIKLNDTPALLAKLLVAPPRPPLQLSAGVLRLEAVHPTNPEKRFQIQLLAARRGPLDGIRPGTE